MAKKKREYDDNDEMYLIRALTIFTNEWDRLRSIDDGDHSSPQVINGVLERLMKLDTVSVTAVGFLSPSTLPAISSGTAGPTDEVSSDSF